MAGKRAGATALMLLVVALVAVPAVYWSHGWRAYVVRTGSMTPTYSPGDVVLDRPIDASPTSGEVITFAPRANELVTHRVVAASEEGLRTKGDANEKRDSWVISPEHVVGIVDGHVPRLGYVIVFLRQPTATAGVVSTSFGLVLLWGLFFPSTGAPSTARRPVSRRQQ